jgi:hypothetical protein
MANLGNTTRPAYVYDAETDTWVPVGVGAHSHDYTSQFIGKTLVDAKGDIVTASASDTPAILSKGADGTVLVADSTTSTGLAWQPYGAQVVAGKNKIINGDFSVWQRGSSFTSPSDNGFTADRWRQNGDGTKGTRIWSRQAFTPGEISGYESQYYMRFQQSVAGSGATYQNILIQPIEDVRTLAGKTVTVSFWAKADTSGRTIAPIAYRFYGTGSPSSAEGINPSPITLTTSWQRYSSTFFIPSLAGKTISSSDHNLQIILAPTFNIVQTIDIWGIQLEEGPIATPFTTATGTIHGELAACQRYYYRINAEHTYGILCSVGFANTTSQWYGRAQHPIPMRIAPSSMEYGGTFRLTDGPAGYTTSVVSLSGVSNKYYTEIAASSSGMTQYRIVYLQGSNDANSYIAFNAEL